MIAFISTAATQLEEMLVLIPNFDRIGYLSLSSVGKDESVDVEVDVGTGEARGDGEDGGGGAALD